MCSLPLFFEGGAAEEKKTVVLDSIFSISVPPSMVDMELVAARSPSAFTQPAENTPASVLHAPRLGPCSARRCWFSMTLLTVSLVTVVRPRSLSYPII